MTFANPLPWWALTAVVGCAVLLAHRAYAHLPVPVAGPRRVALMTLRFVSLVLLIVCLMRPVAIEPASHALDAIVPILIDTSRSMVLSDTDGSRIGRAVQLLEAEILPRLSPVASTEVLAFGAGLRPFDRRAAADGDRSDLRGALRDAAERYRGRNVAGYVLISDGGDTDTRVWNADHTTRAPVYAIGVGSRAVRDVEIATVTAGEPQLADAAIEVNATAQSTVVPDAIELRLLENGRRMQTRRITPEADGLGVTARFLVGPRSDAATVYTVEAVPVSGELTADNNRRSVLVTPPGRKRRVLLVEGAPGFDHSFLTRVWLQDRGLELASIVRKGQNDQQQDTFYIQAPSRALRP